MPLDGTGQWVPAGSSFNPAVNSTTISETDWNALLADLKTALSTAIFKDGQQTVTANVPFAGFKLTGVGAATAKADAATINTIQDGTGVWCGTAGGTKNALTLTPAPAITAYVAGQRFNFKAGTTGSDSTVTVAISGLGTIAIQLDGAALVSGEIIASKFYSVILDTTSTAQLQKITVAASGAITTSTLNMSTGKLLGRTTASTGAIEEISVTAPLSLAAGALTTSMNTAKLIGRATASTGVMEEIALQGGQTVTGGTLAVKTLGTPVATTSGSSWPLTDIPAGAKEVSIMFHGFSTNGTNNPIIQIGPSGGVVTSGYVGCGLTAIAAGNNVTDFTTGFGIRSGAAANVLRGTVRLTLENASTNVWTASGSISAAGEVYIINGSIALSGALAKITVSAGGDTGDAGEINDAWI